MEKKAGVKRSVACQESNHKTTRAANNELCESIKEHLKEAFTQKFGNCHLEMTAGGVFSNTIKSVVCNKHRLRGPGSQSSGTSTRSKPRQQV